MHLEVFSYCFIKVAVCDLILPLVQGATATGQAKITLLINVNV